MVLSSPIVVDEDWEAVEVGRRVILSASDALKLMADGLSATFSSAIHLLGMLPGQIVCTGVGKSGHVARKMAATLSSTGSRAIFVHASEASHGDLGMIGSGDAIIALSKSGETRELADTIAYAKRFGIPLLAVTANPDSTLARSADILLGLPRLPEATDHLEAPTTSTTLQIALGDAIAVALLTRRGFTSHDFGVFHPGGKLGAALKNVGGLMHTGSELPLVELGTPMSEAIVVMTKRRFGCLGVVDRGCLVGIITDGDLRRNLAGLLDREAGDVMTPSPRTAKPSTLAAEALRHMNMSNPPVTVLFIVEGGEPIGILHIHDLLRAGVM